MGELLRTLLFTPTSRRRTINFILFLSKYCLANGVRLCLLINLLLGEIFVKLKISIVSILIIVHIVLFSEENFAEEKAYQNIYGTVWNDKPSEDINYARQMGYDSIAINPSSEVKDYHNNPNCTGLKYYLIDPHWYPQILSGYSRTIDITKPVSEEAKEFYNQRMVWKSYDPFPYNLATGYHPAGSSEQFYVMWDFQQQAVIDEVVEKVISLAKSYEDTGLPFTFGGYIIDEPKLAGEFYRLDETGNNISVGLSYWTGADLGLVHDAITHEYATYSEGMAAFYKELRSRLFQEFANPKWIVQPTLLYSEADNDEWIYQIKVRADKDELTPDMLSQKSPQNTNYVDDANNFNAGIDITKDKVGCSQASETDEYRNRLFAAKTGINGAWYNWFGRFGDTGGMPDFKSITNVYPRLKLIRCLPNWDNLNNVPLSERSWDGSVYQSTKSYAGSDVMYSYHPKTGKLFAVFLTLSGAITLNTGETATSVQRTDGYFIESWDGSVDVSVVGNEIRLNSPDNIGKGYIFTVSADGAPSTVETGSETEIETDVTSGLEVSDETVNGSGLTHTTLVEYYPASGPSNTVSSKKRTNAIISKQSSSSAQTWQQVAKRTQAQKTAGLSGGEGWQMIFGIAYAPSNSNIAYLVTDTNQVWKTTNANADPHDIVWQRKTNGFYANGGVSIVVDPTNSDIVYVAGGKLGVSSDHNDLEVEGIFRTSDGGDNWSLVKVAHFHRSQGYGIHFAFAGSAIYAMPTEGGLLKSTNGGTTWSLVNKSGGGYVLDNNGDITDIKAHPTDNRILFISTSWGLYKVVDSGSSATVTKIGTGLPSRPYVTVINYNDPNIIFATTGVNGVYKSTNGGLNFSQIMTSPVNNGVAGEARQIAMSPVNPNKLIVPYNVIWPPTYLYHTNDGGVNWIKTQIMDEQNADGWVAGSLFAGGYDGSLLGYNDGRPSIVFHPTDEGTALITGYGSVVKKTTDGGVTWKYANTGYTGAFAPFSSLAPIAWDASNPNRSAFFHLDFGAMLTEDNEDTFRSIATIKHNKSRSAIVGALNGDIVVKAVGAWYEPPAYRPAVSRDSGSSFTLLGMSDSDWTYKLIGFHPQNNNILYADIYKFNNIGTSNSYTTLTKGVTAIFRGDGNIVYSSDSGQVYKSTDGGSTWTQPYPSVGKSIRSIAVDPTNQNRIYLAVRNEGVYIITDTAANGGSLILRNDAHGIAKSKLNSIDINSVAVDPNNPNVVYAGAYATWNGHSNGIFRSTDYGMTWENINGNLNPDINVSTISVNPSNSYVYLSSYAGTWKLPPPSSTSAADTTAPNCSISINNGDIYTKSTAVTLALSATDDVGVTGYYLSTSSTTPSASATGWTSITSTRSYNASVSYNLSSSDGKKTLYAWYKDAAGNVSVSATDAITLDKTAPVVTITSPVSSSTYTTTSSTLNLGGNASDSTSGVNSVTWSNNKDGSGTASGTTSWNISGIGLSSGDNVITVTATDGTGNIGMATITVTYNAGIAPTVTTGSATDVTTNSATLNGTVNANGLSTTAWFEYGETSGSYGSTSSTQSAGGSNDATVSIGISGLSVGKTYYYRIAAQNSAGTTYGSKMSFTTSNGTPSTDTSSVLQAFYAFDEGSGTTATDSSGNNRNGTITGATWTTGKIGGALNFDGNDYVTIPSMNYDEISVSAWFNKNVSGTNVIFGGFRYNANVQLQEGFDLYFNSGTPNRLRFVVVTRNTSGTRTVKDATKDFTDSNGSWYHVVGTYNKTTGEQKLYVDGQLVDTQTHPSGNVIVPLTERNYMAIGTRYTDWGFFRGSIDDAHIYNRALSDHEVLSLFNDTVSSDTTSPEVSEMSPANGTTNVAIDSAIAGTFSEAMDAGSITQSTFLVSGGSGTIGGTVSYSGTTVTFTPSGTLAYSTTYTATVTTGVKDVAGNAMAANYTWSFTTGAAPDPTLQAHYAFDEGTGVTATDSSGNNRNGTITGATWTTGKIGGAVGFNGTSNYVSIPRLNYDEISVSTWFYKNANDTANADAIFGGWRWDTNLQLREGFDLRFYPSSPDRLDFILTSKSESGTRTTKTGTYSFSNSVGNWYYAAGTYNKTTGEQKLYVDGQLVNTQLHPAGNTIVPLTSYSDMRIGHSRVNNGYMDGKVDEVRVYNRALSDQEVLDLFNDGN